MVTKPAKSLDGSLGFCRSGCLFSRSAFRLILADPIFVVVLALLQQFVFELAFGLDDVKNVLMCPVGFVSDHLEVLYDIDIECQALAGELGIHLERTESLNTEPLYMETLSDAVHEQAAAFVRA